MFCDRREKIIFAGVEDCAVGSSTRGDDPHHFAAHEFLARTWLFHLIANRDLEAGANQARDVAFGGVVRNAAHGNRLALFAVARRERNLQLARRDDRVFVEKFVEIAQAKEQQGVRVARLDGVILLHQRCCRLAHLSVVSFFIRIVWCPSGGALPETVSGSKPSLRTVTEYFVTELWLRHMKIKAPLSVTSRWLFTGVRAS